MKYLASLLLSLLFISHAYATAMVTLCDESCDLLITFPDGGSIEAVEGLNLIFGTGGELNLGDAGTVNSNPQPASIDFSAGGNLSLAADESITFGNNGVIALGVGGNIDYSNMRITSTGGARIKAVGGAGNITIANMVISGELNLTLEAINNIVVNGAFTLEPSTTLNIIAESNALSPSVCSIHDPAAGTLTLSGSAPLVATGTCEAISGVITIPAGTLSIGSIDPNITLSSSGTVVTSGGTFILDLSDVTALTQELLATLPDGVELPTEDGTMCTLLAGECLSTTGARYAVVDGKLVLPAEAEGSGVVNLFVFAALLLLLSGFRFASVVNGRRSIKRAI